MKKKKQPGLKLQRIIRLKPPFDKVHKDPKKNYGVGSLLIWFILKGRHGAVQVQLGTNCYLADVIKGWGEKTRKFFLDEGRTFDCWDVGYHSKRRMYKGQEAMECNLLPRGKCYYDGSSLRGRDDGVVEIFLEKGEDGVFEYLEAYYRSLYLGEGDTNSIGQKINKLFKILK